MQTLHRFRVVLWLTAAVLLSTVLVSALTIDGGTSFTSVVQLRPKAGHVANVLVRLGVRPGSTQYNQTMVAITAVRDSVTKFFNPTIEFYVNAGGQNSVSQPVYSLGAEGTQESNGTLNAHWLYLWDYARSAGVFTYNTAYNTWSWGAQMDMNQWAIVNAPYIAGGVLPNSRLDIVSTTGAGTTDSINFHVGNNGATDALTLNHSGSATLSSLKTAGAAGGKRVVCVDTNGTLFVSSSGTDCQN